MTNFTEFQAVIFAGGLGNRMMDLSNHMHKVLLPIANIPMFWYPLNMLSKNNITEIILVTNEQVYPEIKRALNDGSLPPLPNIHIEIVQFPSDDLGTADVLRNIKDKIKHDILIVSGDFVADLSLKNMQKMHRANDSWLTCLLTDTALDGPTPGPKAPKLKTNSFIAYVPENDRLVFIEAEEDLETDSVDLNEYLFKKFPKLNLSAKFNDCHLYLMKREVLELLDEINFSSIKADLIPYLLKRQYLEDGQRVSRQTTIHTNHEIELNRQNSSEVNCFAYRTTYDAVTIIAHCNTIGSYFETNKQLIKITGTLKNFSSDIPDSRHFDFKSTGISVNESRISQDSTKIEGEKIVIRNSVIGERCEIGSNVKITGSVIMRGAKISNGVTIDRSIIMPNVEIGENCKIISCIVAIKQIIGINSKLENAYIAEEEEMDMEDDA